MKLSSIGSEIERPGMEGTRDLPSFHLPMASTASPVKSLFPLLFLLVLALPAASLQSRTEPSDSINHSSPESPLQPSLKGASATGERKGETYSGNEGAGLYTLGDRFYGNGQYDMARLQYEKDLYDLKQIGRDDPSLRARIALSLMRDDRYRESLSYLNGEDSFPVLYLHMFASMKSNLPYSAILDGDLLEQQSRYSSEEKDRARLLGGTLLLEKGNYGGAKEFYRRLILETKDDSIRDTSTKILASMDRYTTLPKKRLWLSGLLSAGLPGSGQIYARHVSDGITAFLYNFILIGSAVSLYNLEEKSHSPHAASIVVGSVGLVFYTSNIAGAMAAAKEYNTYQERLFQQEIRNNFFNLDYVERSAGFRFTTKF